MMSHHSIKHFEKMANYRITVNEWDRKRESRNNRRMQIQCVIAISRKTILYWRLDFWRENAIGERKKRTDLANKVEN